MWVSCPKRAWHHQNIIKWHFSDVGGCICCQCKRRYEGMNTWGKGIPSFTSERVKVFPHDCRAPQCATASGLPGNSTINRRLCVKFAVSHDLVSLSLTNKASVSIAFYCLGSHWESAPTQKDRSTRQQGNQAFSVLTEICTNTDWGVLNHSHSNENLWQLSGIPEWAQKRVTKSEFLLLTWGN